MVTFKCMECSFRSKWRFAYDEHVSVHETSSFNLFFNCTYILKDFKCFICNIRSESRKSIKNHINLFHKNQIASVKTNETNNGMYQKNGDQYICLFCSYSSQWNTDLELHFEIQHFAKENVVEKFETIQRINSIFPHLYSDHSYAKKASYKPLSPRKTYKVQQKQADPSRKIAIAEVENNPPNGMYTKNGDRYVCIHCPFAAKWSTDLELHFEMQHSEDAVAKRTEYVCPNHGCDFKVTLKRQLIVHRKKCHDIGKYKCPKCNYYASSEAQLKWHTDNRHEDTKIVQCPYCKIVASFCEETLTLHIQQQHNGNSRAR